MSRVGQPWAGWLRAASWPGSPSVEPGRDEFIRRFLSQYVDPAFEPLKEELGKIADAAWDGYFIPARAPARTPPARVLPIPLRSSPTIGAPPNWPSRRRRRATTIRRLSPAYW